MTLSTLATHTAAESMDSGSCDTASWCTDHADVPDCPGFVIHLSDFEIGRTGVVTGIKAYTWNGKPTGSAQILVFKPMSGTPATPEQWRLDCLRAIAAA